MKLRKWVIYLLVVINCLALLVMGSEVEDLSLFITSHLIAFVIFMINSILLLKFGGDINE